MPVRSQLSGTTGGILFVAEAPADEETVKGWPLVGTAGLLFNQALRAARLTEPGDPPRDFLIDQRGETRRVMWERRAHSFTHVFNEQLPRNEVRYWCAPSQEAKTWEGYDLPRIEGAGYLRPEYLHHLERLQKEIEICQPTLIVPLGGTALWALTGSAGLDAYRGAVGVTSQLVPGIKILPTFAPRTVQQMYKYLMVLIADLTKAAREATFPEIRIPQKEIWLDPTLEDLAEFRGRYIRPDQGPLSVDIETGGGQISCLSLSPTAAQSLIVPFVDYRKPDRSYWPTERLEVQAWQFVGEVLADPEIEKLFQNGGAYDIFWFLERMGIVVRNYRHDLRLVHKTLYPELPASLAFMGATWLNTIAWKAGVSHHKEDEKRDA